MLKQRVITAVFMVLVLVAAIFALPLSGFMCFSAVIVALAAWEWGDLSGLSSSSRAVFALVILALLLLYAFGSNWAVHANSFYVFVASAIWWVLASAMVFSYPISKGIWRKPVVKLLMGVLVLLPTWFAVVYLLDQGVAWFFYLIALVSGADIGAYFAGRAWGKAKLAPKVSPGKSWAGFWGGFAVSMLLAVLAHALSLFELGLPALLLLSAVTMPASVMGDLLESMCKRERGIKDSSQLLPGHGGFLDRLDSLTAAAPLFCLCLLMVC